MNDEYESFFDDPLFQFIRQDGSTTKQIVTPDHRVEHHPLPHGALPVGDVQDFEHEVDASLAGVNSIDPRLIFPPIQYPSSVLSANSPRDDDAATSSSLSAWNCSEGTSPPTSPEYVSPEEVQSHSNADEHNSSTSPPGLWLNEDVLMKLIDVLSDSTAPGASLHQENGTPLHHIVERDVSAPSYASPPSESHEHSPPRHPGAAVAGAYGSGDGMRVHPTNTDIEDSRAGWNGAASSRGDSLTDAGALAPASGVVRRKATAEASSRRQPSAKRTLFCDEPGCSYSTSRSNNLKTHKDEKHLGLRPFRCPVEGCPKSRDGYCRNSEMRKHVAKKHPEYMPPAHEQGPSIPLLLDLI